MSAARSILGECPDCCTCPTPAFQWDSRSGSRSKIDLLTEFGTPSSPPKYYSSTTANGSFFAAPTTSYVNAKSFYTVSPRTFTLSGSVTDYLGTTCDYSGFDDAAFEPQLWDSGSCSGATRDRYLQELPEECPFFTTDTSWGYAYLKSISSTTVRIWGGCGKPNEITETLGDEYTTAILITDCIAALPAYNQSWNIYDTAGSSLNVSSDEVSVALRESRYRVRFPLSKVGFGDCHKITWVERFTPEGGGTVVDTPKCVVWDGTTLAGKWVSRVTSGSSLSSIEVFYGGNFLPKVVITGTGSATGATAEVSSFSTDGKVAAITVTNGGTGYSSATISFTSAGGTTAVATATVSGGAVTAISISNQGDYLPTLIISGGGGTGATATVAMANSGEISSVSLTNSGSGYFTQPNLVLSYYPQEEILLAAHFGTETEYADGAARPIDALPVGYVEGEGRTYPILGDTGTAPWKYYELPVPSTDGETVATGLALDCVDCSACP